MANPSAWRRYIEALDGASPDPGLARFAARFSLASAFDGVNLQGVAQPTVAAYSAGIRVALSYSAVEALDSAMGRRTGRDSLRSPELAADYRSRACAALRRQLEELTQSRALRAKLTELATNLDHTDVMPVAAALRHLVFHGDFTAHGAGAAQSKASRNFMEALSDSLLAHADDSFELFLDRAAVGPWQIDRRKTCPSCGVLVGQLHGKGCDIALCKNHGCQRSSCFEEGRHGPTKYWGVFPGTIDALKRGWVIRRDGRDVPDVVRVIMELQWDPDTESFV